jgi:hypothetical protein
MRNTKERELVMGQIKVTLVLRQSDINRSIKGPFELPLEEGKSVIDVIKRVDVEILKKLTKFPVKGCKSLLHMVYHPFENRFYKQVAIQGYSRPGSFLNVRENLKKPLPDGITIILVPDGPCISEGEDIIDW